MSMLRAIAVGIFTASIVAGAPAHAAVVTFDFSGSIIGFNDNDPGTSGLVIGDLVTASVAIDSNDPTTVQWLDARLELPSIGYSLVPFDGSGSTPPPTNSAQGAGSTALDTSQIATLALDNSTGSLVATALVLMSSTVPLGTTPSPIPDANRITSVFDLLFAGNDTIGTSFIAQGSWSVPEPTGSALAGAGLIGLFVLGRARAGRARAA